MPWGHLHPHLAWTLAGIFTALMGASAVVAWLSRRHPAGDWTELRRRVRTWWVMATVFAVAISLGRTISLAFFAFVSFLALKEYLSMIPTRRADRRVLFWAYLAIPLQYWWAGREWYGMFIIFIPVYAFLFLPTRMVLIGETRGFLSAVGTLHWGLMTTVFSLSHLAYLLTLPASGNPNGAGPALALYLVLLTQLNDVAQYVVGKTYGATKIAPTVSPGKSGEGLLGGIGVTTALAAAMAPLLTPFSFLESILAGTLISLSGFAGDLTISAVKRDLGLKDTGNLLPGHGGILDRVDSISYTAPLFFHFTYYLHF
jgi:phosphatidate cytidylyltransferase